MKILRCLLPCFPIAKNSKREGLVDENRKQDNRQCTLPTTPRKVANTEFRRNTSAPGRLGDITIHEKFDYEQIVEWLGSGDIPERKRSQILGSCLDHLRKLRYRDRDPDKAGFVKLAKLMLNNGVGLDECTGTSVKYPISGPRRIVTFWRNHRQYIKPEQDSILRLLAGTQNPEAADLIKSQASKLKNIAQKYNEKPLYEYNPIHLAAKFGLPETLDLLVTNEFSLKRPDQFGYLPLAGAAQCNSPQMVEKLCEYSMAAFQKQLDRHEILSIALEAAKKNDNAQFRSEIIDILKAYRAKFGIRLSAA